MKNLSILTLTGVALLALASCGTHKNAASKAYTWYEGKTWQQGFPVEGYEAMDVATFYDQYQKAPAMYDSIFVWLASVHSQAAALPAQKNVMTWSHATAHIQDLELRPIDKCKFEQHREHIDLQWDVTGAERYGMVRDTTLLEPINEYSEKKDVQNFRLREPEKDNYYQANSTPGRFFLFFPGDIHRPCQIGNRPETVRKIVVKIEYLH